MIKFDSDINNPVIDAINIISKEQYKPSYMTYLTKFQNKKEALAKLRHRYFIILFERFIKGNTLKNCGQILDISTENVRRIEAKLKRILSKQMKGRYYDN